MIFFFKQKTAYEMRISDWSSDVCSSDLQRRGQRSQRRLQVVEIGRRERAAQRQMEAEHLHDIGIAPERQQLLLPRGQAVTAPARQFVRGRRGAERIERSEEHTSELQSLMRISYAVFCLKKKKKQLR